MIALHQLWVLILAILTTGVRSDEWVCVYFFGHDPRNKRSLHLSKVVKEAPSSSAGNSKFPGGGYYLELLNDYGNDYIIRREMYQVIRDGKPSLLTEA